MDLPILSEEEIAIDKGTLTKFSIKGRFDTHSKEISYFYHPEFKNPKSAYWLRRKIDLDLNFHVKNEQNLTIHYSNNLNKDTRFELFRKMNYYKYQAHVRTKNVRTKDAKKRLLKADEYKNILVLTNMRLGVKNASKKLNSRIAFETLVNESYFSLIKAVDTFNPYLGFQFSTYATRIIFRDLDALIQKTFKHRSEPTISISNSKEPTIEDLDFIEKETALDRKQYVKKILSELSEEEKSIILNRYGFDDDKVIRLREIGERLGVSKERVRQKQLVIEDKIRNFIREKKLESLGMELIA